MAVCLPFLACLCLAVLPRKAAAEEVCVRELQCGKLLCCLPHM